MSTKKQKALYELKQDHPRAILEEAEWGLRALAYKEYNLNLLEENAASVREAEWWEEQELEIKEMMAAEDCGPTPERRNDNAIYEASLSLVNAALVNL